MPTIDQSNGVTKPVRKPLRKVVVTVLAMMAVPLFAIGALAAWYEYEMTRNEVIVAVDNRAAVPVDVLLFDTEPPTPALALKAVAAGHEASQDQNMWRVISPAKFRVQVGPQIFQGDAGVLLDDDGPHRFWVKTFDDHVVVTRQSNESPWELKMLPLGSATQR